MSYLDWLWAGLTVLCVVPLGVVLAAYIDSFMGW